MKAIYDAATSMLRLQYSKDDKKTKSKQKI